MSGAPSSALPSAINVLEHAGYHVLADELDEEVSALVARAERLERIEKAAHAVMDQVNDPGLHYIDYEPLRAALAAVVGDPRDEEWPGPRGGR